MREAADLETVHQCPVCGSGERWFADFATAMDEGWAGVYLMCRMCGLVFQSPRPTEAALEAFYAREYLESTLESQADAQRDRWVQQQRADHLTDLAGAHIEDVAIHVDVGASRGTLMEALRQRFGCKTIGVEPGEERRRQVQEVGLEMVASTAALPAEIQGLVDLITMAHVLEHLRGPVEELSGIRSRLLRPAGWLLLEVPNLLCHKSFERAHLHAFTPETLERTLRAAGFEVVELITHGRPHSRRFPLYILALARAIDRSPPGREELRVGVSPVFVRIRRTLWRTVYGASYWVWVAKSLLTGRRGPPWTDS